MKMKRLILVTAIIFGSLLCTPSFGQIKFGVKGGVEIDNSINGLDALKVKNLTSYHVGPALEFMLPMSSVDLGVDVALLYSNNKMNVSSNEDKGINKDINNQYLMLPLNAKLKFNLGSEAYKLYLLGGPYAGLLISGDKISIPDIGENIKAKAFEGGLNLGFGFELWKFLQLGANYKIKLTDDYALDKPEWSDPFNGKSQTWSITAGIFF